VGSCDGSSWFFGFVMLLALLLDFDTLFVTATQISTDAFETLG
jgi:hypothetical protein